MMTLNAIAGFHLVAADPERLAGFYGALGFMPEGIERITEAEMALLGIPGGGTRRILRLGATRLALDTFDAAGRVYPEEATANDTIFQHFALATGDAAAAWTVAQAFGALPISAAGPVTLPPSTGGVTAIKFRDPEGHPLEFLEFPDGRVSPDTLAGGIDHSAISVGDAVASVTFYEVRGLRVGARTLNHGAGQDALDGVTSALVDVVPLMPAGDGPHLELLGYRAPEGRAMHWQPNDIAATRILWHGDGDALLVDPDGHLHQIARG